MKKEFNVVINTDDNYIQHCMAMLQSLYVNNNMHTIILHVLENRLNPVNVSFIQNITKRFNNQVYFYNVNEAPLDGVQFRNSRPLSKAAYYRLLLSSVLPDNVHIVLYLDCDMIIMDDVSELFNIDISEFALAATLDDFPYTNQHRMQLQMDMMTRTFCSGMMLVNLDYWRIHNSEEALLHYATKIKRKEVHLHDQDVLNYVFKGSWFMLPPKWNKNAGQTKPLSNYWYKKFDIDEYLKSPKIIHYAAVGKKPWYNAVQPERMYYVKHLEDSGYSPIIYQEVSFHKKIELLRECIEYFFNKNIIRFIPNIIIILFFDLLDLIKLPVRLYKRTGVYKTLNIKK